MTRIYATKHRAVALEALQAGDITQSDLVAKGLSPATACRQLRILCEIGLAHICRYSLHPHGGPMVIHYRTGPRPPKFYPWKPRVSTDKTRVAGYRKRMRASGEWADTLARRRATYWAKKPAQRDALTAAFFGGTT